MQPIYNEQITMWRDLGFDLPIGGGKYWMNNHFICGFKDGVLTKLWKYKVLDDLSIVITPLPKVKFDDADYETWEDTVKRYSGELMAKIEQSMVVIYEAYRQYGDYYKVLMTSSGKDSMVTFDLVQKIFPDIEVYFNNTSIDVADTYKMVKAHTDWHIINPEIGFYQYCVDNHFIPTRFSRGCCTEFKEVKTTKVFNDKPKMLFFMGVRNDESNVRADREDFSHNPKWRSRDWYSCLPIRRWSEFDVWLYIIKYNIEVNPKYKKGYSRVGCAISCPYYTKYTWVLDKYWYPRAYNRWREFLRKVFAQENRWTKLNCTTDEYVEGAWCGGLYRPEPTDEVVAEFMTHQGISDKNVALQYFNKACGDCGKNVRQSEVVAMNLKLHGRDTEQFYCKKHLCERHNLTKVDWERMVEGFKAQGCELF